MRFHDGTIPRAFCSHHRQRPAYIPHAFGNSRDYIGCVLLMLEPYMSGKFDLLQRRQNPADIEDASAALYGFAILVGADEVFQVDVVNSRGDFGDGLSRVGAGAGAVTYVDAAADA